MVIQELSIRKVPSLFISQGVEALTISTFPASEAEAFDAPLPPYKTLLG